MPSKPAYELTHRVSRAFDRHFRRHARDVVVYVDPNRTDCPVCFSVGPLGSSVDANCSTCSGKGYLYTDSSACLTAIVVSAEPRRSVTQGVIEHSAPASFHNNAFIVVFKIGDVVLDPIRFPNRTVFETTADSKIEWSSRLYSVKSYAADGVGAEDNYLKVYVEKTEE